MNKLVIVLVVAFAVFVAVNGGGHGKDKKGGLKNMMNAECTGPKEGLGDGKENKMKEHCQKKENPEECMAKAQAHMEAAKTCAAKASSDVAGMEKEQRCENYPKKFMECMGQQRKNKGE